jgi:hypothetical protein
MLGSTRFGQSRITLCLASRIMQTSRILVIDNLLNNRVLRINTILLNLVMHSAGKQDHTVEQRGRLSSRLMELFGQAANSTRHAAHGPLYMQAGMSAYSWKSVVSIRNKITPYMSRMAT